MKRGDVITITSTGNRAVINRVDGDEMHVVGDGFGRWIDKSDAVLREGEVPTSKEAWNISLDED